MPEIVETVRVAGTADALWRDVGKFGAVGNWHPMLAWVESEGEQPGCLRTAEGKDGSRQTERLQEVAPARHFYRYRMESTPMPVRHYVGELRAEENGDGTSTVIWSARFEVTADEPDKTVASIRAFLKAGLDNLCRLRAGSAT